MLVVTPSDGYHHSAESAHSDHDHNPDLGEQKTPPPFVILDGGLTVRKSKGQSQDGRQSLEAGKTR